MKMNENEYQKKAKTLDEVNFEILWEGKPAGLWQRFLTLLKLNFTTYQISNDELIIKTGFFNQKTNTTELYLLKDPDISVSLWQRLLKIGTVSVLVDTHSTNNRAGQKLFLRNIRDCEKVRKILRDAIEDDVMERKITYFDKV